MVSLNKSYKNRKCLFLFTANTNILILLYRELKTDAKVLFLPFVLCRLSYEIVDFFVLDICSDLHFAQKFLLKERLARGCRTAETLHRLDRPNNTSKNNETPVCGF